MDKQNSIAKAVSGIDDRRKYKSKQSGTSFGPFFHWQPAWRWCWG